jgi:hypothetical protein
VLSVTLAGVPLGEHTAWELVGSDLVRIDGTWPRTGALVIRFTYGEDPPQDLLDATGILAVNRAAQCAGGHCEIPAKTKTISAEGMSIEVDADVPGETGIKRVDDLLALGWPLPSLVPSGGCDPAVAASGFDRVDW